METVIGTLFVFAILNAVQFIIVMTTWLLDDEPITKRELLIRFIPFFFIPILFKHIIEKIEEMEEQQ